MGQFDGADQVERVALHQHHIGALHRDIRASTDCEADIGLSQSPSVVLADHTDLLGRAWSSWTLLALSPGNTSANTLSIRRLFAMRSAVPWLSPVSCDLDAARAAR
jgi:hypothetical protein